MAFDGGKVSASTCLKKALIDQLQLGLSLIRQLDDRTYSLAHDRRGSIGAHLRHNINFVETLIDGAISGSIDYANRTRDRRVETDRSVASGKLLSLIEAVEAVPMDPAMPVKVVSEIDPTLRHRSTLGRELEFVISHTVHHYALINERLKAEEIEKDPRFGVAPSTLEYWQTSER